MSTMITRMLLTVLRVHAHYPPRNITFPLTLRSSKWTVSLRSPHRKPVRTSLVSHTSHMHCPSPSWFYHPWIFAPWPQTLLIPTVRNYPAPGFKELIKATYLIKIGVLLPYVNYLNRCMNSVGLLGGGRKLESCCWQIWTKHKYLLYFCTAYNT
jgi:hypothetical protein